MSKFHAQHAEDRLLAEHFHYKRDGYFVEVGALDGKLFSNTAFFETELGWTGVLVEANPEQAERCRGARPHSTVFARAAVSPSDAGNDVLFEVVEGYEALSTRQRTAWAKQLIDDLEWVDGRQLEIRTVKVPAATLDQMLDDAGTEDIDFLTLDIEGFEWEALQGLSLGTRWFPKVVLIERAGLPEIPMLRFMTRAGFVFRRSVGGNNDWFEPGDNREVAFGLFKLYLAALRPAARRGTRRLVARAGLLSTARRVKGSVRR